MSKRIHEIQFNFCPKSKTSTGVRTWINKNYADLKKLNPRMPFLIRDFEGIEPVMRVHYDFKILEAPLSNFSEEEVEQKVIEFVQLSDPETHPEDHPYKKTWVRYLDQDNVDGIKGVEDSVVRIN